MGLNKNSMCITHWGKKGELCKDLREKQIITERLSCLLSGNDGVAGEGCTEENQIQKIL